MIKFGEISSEVQKLNPENTEAFKEIKPQDLLNTLHIMLWMKNMVQKYLLTRQSKVVLTLMQ